MSAPRAPKDEVKDRAIRITLVRHGESVANQIQRWQGQGDSPLSDLGRQQAVRLGHRLAQVRFHRVIASDLTRARDTAAATGHAFDTDAAWREFDVGAWEGLTREEVDERYPDEIRRLKAGEDVPMGGGESYRTFSERVDSALLRLRGELRPGDHALVVCHGGVIGALIAGLLGLRGGPRWPLTRASNTSVSEVRLDGATAELCVYNDASHLWPATPWPHRDEDAACVALVADADPAGAHGQFAARYDVRGSGAATPSAFAPLVQARAAGGSAPQQADLVAAALSELRERHAGERVAVALEGDLIMNFVAQLLWLDRAPQATLRSPPRGSLSHVAMAAGRPALLDYAAALAREA